MNDNELLELFRRCKEEYDEEGNAILYEDTPAGWFPVARYSGGREQIIKLLAEFTELWEWYKENEED